MSRTSGLKWALLISVCVCVASAATKLFPQPALSGKLPGVSTELQSFVNAPRGITYTSCC